MLDITDPEVLALAACLHPNDGYRYAAKVVREEDFRNYSLGKLYRLIGDLDRNGEVCDPAAVLQLFAEYEINTNSITPSDLWNMVSAVGTGEQAEFYGLIVHDKGRRRRAYAALSQAAQHLEHDGIAVDETLQSLHDTMAALSADTVHDRINPQLLRVLYADWSPEEQYDWLVPGLFERGDRMIITAADGFGKSTYLKQLCIMFAGGLHPIRANHIDPLKCLYIDPENSKKQWLREAHPIIRATVPRGTVNPMDNIYLANTPRLNLVKGHDLARIHRLLDLHGSDILFIGPLYKLVAGSLNNEDDAAALINSLDSIHDRGVTIVMEAHPAKGSNGYRNWTPRGSAALSGWPEFGLALTPDPDDDDQTIVERWRGDRDKTREWPTAMRKSSTFPWLPC